MGDNTWIRYNVCLFHCHLIIYSLIWPPWPHKVYWLAVLTPLVLHLELGWFALFVGSFISFWIRSDNFHWIDLFCYLKGDVDDISWATFVHIFNFWPTVHRKILYQVKNFMNIGKILFQNILNISKILYWYKISSHYL